MQNHFICCYIAPSCLCPSSPTSRPPPSYNLPAAKVVTFIMLLHTQSHTYTVEAKDTATFIMMFVVGRSCLMCFSRESILGVSESVCVGVC